jgi:hypothetical protein
MNEGEILARSLFMKSHKKVFLTSANGVAPALMKPDICSQQASPNFTLMRRLIETCVATYVT